MMTQNQIERLIQLTDKKATQLVLCGKEQKELDELTALYYQPAGHYDPLDNRMKWDSV